MFKNQPPDRLWEEFLYLTASKNHARLTGSLRIVRKPRNETEIDPKIFPGRRQRRSLLNSTHFQVFGSESTRHFLVAGSLHSIHFWLISLENSIHIQSFCLPSLGQSVARRSQGRSVARSVARSLGRSLGRSLARSLLCARYFARNTLCQVLSAERAGI